MAHDLPLLNSIKDAKLTKLDEPDVSITASSLWEKQPVMVMVVRRPGCKLCRAQVQFMSQFRDEFARRNIRLLAVSHQEDSVQEFAEKFLGHKEDMFLDKKKDFYRCLGDGHLRSKGYGALFHYKFWQNFRNAGDIKGNLSGDGFLLGGFLLIGQGDKGISWMFKEENYGDKPERGDVIQAINSLVPMEPITVKKEQAEKAKTTEPAAASSSSPKPAGSSPKPTSSSPKPDAK